MANLNDFKLLNLKCEAYFNLFQKSLELPSLLTLKEEDKLRCGFYLFILETYCNCKDVNILKNYITDQHFNQMVFQKPENDYGVDAIFIDENEKYINLFNFKYRSEFKLNQKQSINETLQSTKLLNMLLIRDIKLLKQGKLKDICKVLIDKLNSKEIWKLRLYAVSNEAIELDINDPEIQSLIKKDDIELVPIGLTKIAQQLSLRPEKINAILYPEENEVIPFAENSRSSSISYIVKISAVDLIRITCNDPELREKYYLTDSSELCNIDMDYNLLFDNVRGLVSRSKFNNNIFNTLSEEPTKFFMYNNGLTLTSGDIKCKASSAQGRMLLTLNDFQVVNGGQTLRTLHSFNRQKDTHIDKLSKCQLLLRIFKTDTNNGIKNKIAEFTNSQNTISSVDLKSLSTEQMQIEQFLDEKNIIYARKAGDTGFPDKNYGYKIDMEKLGQILFSIQGSPEKVSNQKKQIFDKYYDEVFKEKFDLSQLPSYIELYRNIYNTYDICQKNKMYESSDQKHFYILYISQHLKKLNISEQIDFFEAIIKKFASEKNKKMAESRILILLEFKDFLDKNIEEHKQL